MVSFKGMVVRNNESKIVDGIAVQRITVETKGTQTLCLLSGSQTDKVKTGDLVKVEGTPKKFNATNRAFGKYVQVTSVKKIE